MSTTIKILPCQLTDTFTLAQFNALALNLGDVYEGPSHRGAGYGTARYRAVLLVDAVDAVVAKVAFAATSGRWDVTLDASGGTARAGLMPIGMFIGTVDVSAAPYCFVQTSGVAQYTAGSSAIIDGDDLKPDASEDGDLDEATYGTHKNIIGWSIGVVADNAVGDVMLTNCP